MLFVPGLRGHDLFSIYHVQQSFPLGPMPTDVFTNKTRLTND